MWDCPKCGCKAVAASIPACPACGAERPAERSGLPDTKAKGRKGARMAPSAAQGPSEVTGSGGIALPKLGGGTDG